MKKIVVDGIIFSLQRSGGISRVWADLLLELDKVISKDLSVTLLIPKNKNVEWLRVKERITKIVLLPRRRFRWGKRSIFLESLYLSYLAMSLRPHIWHTSYYVGYPIFPKKLVRVAMFYDMIPEVLGKVNPYDSRVKGKTLEMSDVITAISQNSLKDLVRFYPKVNAQMKVLYLFQRVSDFGEGHLLRQVVRPYFLFVGKRGGYKNFLQVLEVILEKRAFLNFHIFAVGDESFWSEEELSVLEKYKARWRVHNLGVVSTGELGSLMCNSELVLYPSLYEGFGLPILEAFQFGVPVIACNTSSIPELVGEKYPLCDPDSPASWGCVFNELLSNREKWIDYGKERVRRFTVEKAVEETLSLYANL